jgi:TRAP transporter TAXI family solute receptor
MSSLLLLTSSPCDSCPGSPQQLALRGLRSLVTVLFVLCVATGSAVAGANDDGLTVLRVGTGGIGGTYFPVGSLIAQSISEHRDDDGRVQAQGVKGLLAVVQTSNGSIANVNGMRRGHLDAALAQSDVVYWSYHGMAVFGGQPRQGNLRAIAHLYPESLHLVARSNSGIARVEDLRERRVSFDELGSGTIPNPQSPIHS